MLQEIACDDVTLDTDLVGLCSDFPSREIDFNSFSITIADEAIAAIVC